MQSAYITNGTLTDERTVALDEALPLSAVRVRVVVEPLSCGSDRMPFAEFIDRIRKRQQTRGFRPSSKDDVDAEIRAERESWD